jgi:hypothetical protein
MIALAMYLSPLLPLSFLLRYLLFPPLFPLSPSSFSPSATALASYGVLSGREHALSKKPFKQCVRVRKDQVNLVIQEISLEEILSLVGKDLISRFSGKTVGTQALSCWLDQHWLPLFSYKPEAHTMVRGWLIFFFCSEEDATIILDKKIVHGIHQVYSSIVEQSTSTQLAPKFQF